jgi:pyruvate formate lyase activating enzyme
MTDANTKGKVFNIQRYSIHDGPGIRTTVFINGCPLRCVWCQNPESQSMIPSIFFMSERCTGCGKCVETCPEKAITIVDGKATTDRSFCKGCGICAEVCPNEARDLMGKEMTAEEVFKEANSDAIFYQGSGGGVTISGGDPVAQPDFVIAILKMCKNAGLHTALETSGVAEWYILKKILPYTDMVLYDFKHMDAEEHTRFTGKSNRLALENAKKIITEFSNIVFVARVPVIPGHNDSEENVTGTARFIAQELENSIKVHLLPYHKLGVSKYERLEDPGKIIFIEPPSEEHMERLRQLVESAGLTGVVGG